MSKEIGDVTNLPGVIESLYDVDMYCVVVIPDYLLMLFK